MTAILGYARVSSTGQDLDAQLAALTAAGVDADRVFPDQLSGSAKTGRPQLVPLRVGEHRTTAAILLGTLLPQRQRDALVRDGLANLVDVGHGATLESTWRVNVEPKWGRRRIADIRRTEVQTWVAQLKLSASSVAHAHTVLAGILDDAVADRRLATNPARGIKLPRKTMSKSRNG
jgi:Resolvase, N terminal domain